MNYSIIGSSSKGNAIVVENVLLLDCGLSYAKIKSYLKDIKLIKNKNQLHSSIILY